MLTGAENAGEGTEAVLLRQQRKHVDFVLENVIPLLVQKAPCSLKISQRLSVLARPFT